MPRYAVPYTVAATRAAPAGAGVLYVHAETPDDALTRAQTIHRGELTPKGRRRGGLPKSHAARIVYGDVVEHHGDTMGQALARRTLDRLLRERRMAELARLARQAAGAARWDANTGTRAHGEHWRAIAVRYDDVLAAAELPQADPDEVERLYYAVRSSALAAPALAGH